MNWVDFWIVFFVVLIVLSIIFFMLILPKIRNKDSKCHSCENVRKVRRLFKDYHKENDKK